MLLFRQKRISNICSNNLSSSCIVDIKRYANYHSKDFMVSSSIINNCNRMDHRKLQKKMTKLWFKSKSFGWGWTPCSIEGWLVTIAFISALIILAFTLREDNTTSFLLWLVSLMAVLIIICYKKGEKPRWRWGKK